MRWVRGSLLVVLFQSLMVTASGGSGELRKQQPEYPLKAAYLYNFTKFVNWPDETFGADDAPLNICIKGPMPDSGIISKLNSQTTRGHPLRILSVNGGPVDECHLLYFRQMAQREVHQTLQKIQDRPVLTVGEYRGFAREDGIIEFEITDSQRIKLIINQVRAKDLRITISAQLLEIASVLEGSAAGE
ncbi:MAG: YfiR family protein [Ketobacteraceae bacterium]|nr:YfiR family protein [Ketobacteraceae bacterium]